MNRKVQATFVLVLVALILNVAPAAAGRYWCRADPIVAFNGTPVQVWVEMPGEYEYLVNGPIQVNVTAPTWVGTEVLFTDAGFNGFGERVTFETNREGAQQAGDIYRWNEDYEGILVNQPTAFTVKFEIKVPLDKVQLRKDFRAPANSVPVRLLIVDADGSEQVVGGNADGASITVNVEGLN